MTMISFRITIFILLLSFLWTGSCRRNVWEAADSLPRNGTVVVKRVLRNYIAEKYWECPCQYIYNFKDTCPEYFNKALIRRTFPFITNIDSFINANALGLALSTVMVRNAYDIFRQASFGKLKTPIKG